MGLIEQFKELVGAGHEKQYEYACGDCEHEFESPATNPNETECPECGSDRIHSAL